MPDPYLREKTLDDLLHAVFEAVLQHGAHVTPSKGGILELTGVLLELTNPRARLSRTESRGRPFSCLGELCWYLAGSHDTAFITHYISDYKKYDEGGVIFGAYGPRLFKWKDVNQVENVIDLLRKRRDSRRAVIQLFDATDLVGDHKEVPCTCTLQFMIRQDRLHLIVSMRSNDAFIGLPHDVFCFTMLQEIVACALDVELGAYKHSAGSMHIYDTDIADARTYLEEGFQATTVVMPSMPKGDPWPHIRQVLQAEKALRLGNADLDPLIAGLPPYWTDIVRLLKAFRSIKGGAAGAELRAIKGALSSKVFDLFIDQRLRNAPQ